MATSSPSKLPFFSLTVPSCSGGLAGAKHDRRIVSETRPVLSLSVFFQSLEWPEVILTACQRANWVSFTETKRSGSSVQGPVSPLVLVALIHTSKRRREPARTHTHTSTHTSGFLFRAGCVRLDLWVGNEASLCVCGSKSCNPPLPPSPSPLQTPLLLIWMTCQTKAIDANTLWFANAKNRGSKWGGLWVCHTGRKGREINKEFRVTNIRLY